MSEPRDWVWLNRRNDRDELAKRGSVGRARAPVRAVYVSRKAWPDTCVQWRA